MEEINPNELLIAKAIIQDELEGDIQVRKFAQELLEAYNRCDSRVFGYYYRNVCESAGDFTWKTVQFLWRPLNTIS